MFRLSAVLLALCCGMTAIAPVVSGPPLHGRREAASDLEITGLVQNVPRGQSRFVSHDFLASLPQVEVTVEHNENFNDLPQGGMKIGGLYLDDLAKSLGADGSADAIEAVCEDGYTSTFTAGYIKQHRPIFALTVSGLTLHAWAEKYHMYDPSPYLITYENFVPAFRLLGHEDHAQQPAQVVTLHFDTAQKVLGSITPPQSNDGHPASLEVMQGFRIAQQNCFRCHNSGVYGGTKAKQSWQTLAKIASRKPKYFAAWVHEPRAIDPKAEMPANLEYDQATLDALTRYFQSFSPRGE
jgi:mono/diheme cytochrome c family protein